MFSDTHARDRERATDRIRVRQSHMREIDGALIPRPGAHESARVATDDQVLPREIESDRAVAAHTLQ